MKSELETYGYHITSDPSFMNEQNAMTPELGKQLDKLHDVAIKGKESGLKKLQKLIEKHPRNPQLKNYLSVWYMSRGDTEKSKEVNHWLIAEHPNYLFGKLNLAFEYYTKGEPKKMAEILGKEMELKALYPHRDTFHIVEVMGMLKAAVFYFGAIGDLEQAETRLDIMEELEPESLDFEQANRQLMAEKMNRGMSLLMQNKDTELSVDVDRPIITDKTEFPKFNHPEIELLYNNDLTISDKDIKTILALPKKSLISDLELILSDSIERYAYFLKITDEEYKENEMSFVIHSFYFLAELDAKDSLNKILEVLSQGEEYINLYIGDFITECFWEILLKLGSDNLDLLKDFMKKPGVYNYSKSEVARALEQLANHYPERKQEVVRFFEDIFNFYLISKPEDNVIDGEMIGLVIANVIDFNGFELLPLIKKLDDKGYICHGICGDYNKIEKAFYHNKKSKLQKDKILNLSDRYKQITTSWASYQDDEVNKEAFEDAFTEMFNNDTYLTTESLTVKEKKIGRNEPCPCGSGKKYKKCCLNK